MERWVPIQGYEGYYEVSSEGRVKRLKTIVPTINRGKPNTITIKERILKPDISYQRNGKPRLLRVTLSKKGITERKILSHIVLESFIAKKPINCECCHADGNALNNKIENLRWDTHKNNEKDKILHGTYGAGGKARKKNVPDECIELLGTMSDFDLGQIFSLSKKTILMLRRKHGIQSYAEVNDHPTRYKPGNYPQRWV